MSDTPSIPVAPSAPPLLDRWLTVNEAAALVHVSRRTLYTWMADGKVEVRRTASGAPRVRESSLWQREDQ